MPIIPPEPPGGKPPKPKISSAPKPPPPMSRSGFVRTPQFESPSIEYDYGPSFPPAGCAKVKLAILAAVGMDPIKGIVHVLRAWFGVTRSLVTSGVWLFPEWHREIDRILQFLASSQRLVEGIWSTPRAEVKTALEAMREYKALLRWFARKLSPADPPAGAQSGEFEERILAAIEEAEPAHKLPPLSSNRKRVLFLRLKELRQGLGFIDGAHQRWPASPEKRQQAARSWLVSGEEGLYDRRIGRAISNEQELHAVLYGSQNEPETIDLIGHAETVQLLAKTFQEIAGALYAAWSAARDPLCEEFNTSIEFVRCLVIAECRAEWPGRRLAERKVSPPEPVEFEEPPPFWFHYRALGVEAGLEGAYLGARPVSVAVWINQAREYELKLRGDQAVAEAAGLATETPAPAAAGAAPPKEAGETGEPSADHPDAAPQSPAVEAAERTDPPPEPTPRGRPVEDLRKRIEAAWPGLKAKLGRKPEPHEMAQKVFPEFESTVGKKRANMRDVCRQAIKRARLN